ncbi:sulfotransferase [uncultured Shimia sp.]|uniref:sulfotransferase n=1 Tax=uncultured Shimia sp. TaxID=573152 RepID=UPI00260ED54F|nr:sulfotransferase [uncultured Shimia sp.]
MRVTTGKIIIHAGFHKTGTSSVQATLRHNRTNLKPHAALALKWRIKDLTHAMRGYSTWPDPISLMKVTHRLDQWLNDMPDLKNRGLIVSAEELAGHMPGREEIADYSAAAVLAREIRDAFVRRYRQPDLHFVYTTRAASSWLNSAYWEHVKSSSMTITQDTFLGRFPNAANFGSVLDKVQTAVSPYSVTHVPIEDCNTLRLGPAERLLKLAGLTDADLKKFEPILPANTRLPIGVLQELLDLNRNISDREARSAAKKAVLQRHEESAAS